MNRPPCYALARDVDARRMIPHRQCHAVIVRPPFTAGRSPARSAGRSHTNARVPTSSASVTCPKATPHPMHYGTICLIGTGCITIQGNRNLADFFAVGVDSTGAAEIAQCGDNWPHELHELRR